MKSKADIRKDYKKLRDELTEKEVDEASLEIANKALELDIWGANYYHIFLPIASKKEVNTEYLLHILSGKDKTVIVPKANFETGAMLHILLQEHTVIKNSSYGIPEPQEGIEVRPQQLDVVFVPLLAYDVQGNRLGYGKGFYDRFLSQCRPDCLLIGLSFFPPEKTIPHEIIDFPLNLCITPSEIYHF